MERAKRVKTAVAAGNTWAVADSIDHTYEGAPSLADSEDEVEEDDDMDSRLLRRKPRHPLLRLLLLVLMLLLLLLRTMPVLLLGLLPGMRSLPVVTRVGRSRCCLKSSSRKVSLRYFSGSKSTSGATARGTSLHTDARIVKKVGEK